MLLARVTAGAALIFACLLFAASPSLATSRYAGPSGSTSDPNCTDPNNPCEIAHLLDTVAQNNDDITVEPGTYNPSAQIDPAASGLTVHGQSGAPRPVINGANSYAYPVYLLRSNMTLSNLEFDANSGAGWALWYGGPGSVADHIVVRATNASVGGFYLTAGSTLTSSSVSVSHSGIPGLEVDNGTLIGDTIEATGAGDDGLLVSNTGSNPYSVTVTNSIVRGGGSGGLDVHASNTSTGSIAINLDHSDFAAATPNASGVTITSPNSAGNLTQLPALANPSGGDLHELAGSPTINAGAIVGGNGLTDLFGNPRLFAAGTPCQGTDIGAHQFEPAAAPVVVNGAPSGLTPTTATLTGTSDPGGGAEFGHFDYGPPAAGGGPPSTPASTPTQCLGPGNGPQAISAGIAGLTAGMTYYFRLVSTNATGTTTSAWSNFTAPSNAPPPQPPKANAGRASVSGANALAPVFCTGATGSACRIIATMTVTETFRGHKLVSITRTKKSKRTKKVVTVGTASVTLLAGRTQVLSVSLNGTGKRLLSTRRKLPVKLTITQAGTGSSVVISAQTLTFKASKKHKRKK